MQTKTMERRMSTAWKERIPFERAADVRVFYDILDRLEAEHQAVQVTSLGESVLGRRIPVVTLGENRASRGILAVGGLVGTDPFTPAVLLRFVRDYAEFLEAGRRIYSVSMPYLYTSRTIHVIPMLNPDGYAIRRYGAEDVPVKDRLKEIAGGENFSGWRYNARGVDLKKNFIFGLEEEEDRGLYEASEPESAALCRYVEMGREGVFGKIELAMELHAEGGDIRCTSGEAAMPRSRTVARLLSRMIGCQVLAGERAGGSITDHLLQNGLCTAFSCGCLPEGSEVHSVSEEYVRIYAAFREALFSAPLLI